MGRLNKNLTTSTDIISGATYNPMGEMLTVTGGQNAKNEGVPCPGSSRPSPDEFDASWGHSRAYLGSLAGRGISPVDASKGLVMLPGSESAIRVFV
jgi:hypothetical protein